METIKDKIKAFFNKKDTLNTKIKTKLKISFLESLSNLLNSWIPLLNAIEIILLQSKNKTIKNILLKLKDKLKNGSSLSEALFIFPNIFTQFDISIIEMWEITWWLWESVEIIQIKEEKTRELKQKIMWALIYPIVIISLATIMIIVFMVYVIPKIQDMYKDAKVNLPSLTQTIIDISTFMQDNLIYLIIWFFVFISAIIYLRNNKITKIYFDKALLHLPIFWVLFRKKIIALFSNNLWTLISKWIIINKALEISSKALENDYYEKEIQKIIIWVSKWEQLSNLMWINDLSNWKKENFLFPLELSSVINIWEQTWKLAELLLKISSKYNKEIDNIVKNLATAIEPIVIVWVWLIIWTIIMAIMLPFFNMVNVI